jgi:hypothetical protein
MPNKFNPCLSLAAAAIACAAPAFAQTFSPGNLVLSRSVYSAPPSAITVGEQLPPVCGTSATCTGQATNDATYPYVFNNDLVDGSFGITSPIFLDQITTGGALLNTYAVSPAAIVTSFSSKSEIALNLSTDGSAITFMGYAAPLNTLDVSNSNTPGVIDPTNPVGTAFAREVAHVDAYGNLTVTPTNAYSGNNGRAAILSNSFYYTVGNSNNGSGTPANVVGAAGAQLVTPGTNQLVPSELGSFSITQYGYTADKAGKDNNFRGLTIFNNTLYVDKGSGSNGINTVYQVGTAGTLPTPSTIPVPITILPGFPTTLAKAAGAQNPFGLFFANATTLYVADEGDGTAADAATSPNAGIQKWILSNGTWTRVYVLQNGLKLGQQYSVPNYPTALNPATDGLRNITGRVNTDGTVTLWAVTSTISASGDQGADPNKLVSITDVLANTSPTLAASETFSDIRDAQYGEVLRGVCFTPGTTAPASPASLPITTGGLVYNRKTASYSQTITVLNNTSTAVNAPLSVVFSGLSAGVTLSNKTATVASGPALSVLPSGSLAPGQSVTVTAVFSDPTLAAVNYTTSLIAQ